MRIVFNLRDQDWQTTKSLGILHASIRTLRAMVQLPGIEHVNVLANHSLRDHLAGLETLGPCRIHFLDKPAPRRLLRLLWDHSTLVRTCDPLAPDWLLLPKGFSPLLRWPAARVSAFVHDNVFEYYRRHRLSAFPRYEAALFHRMLVRTAGRAQIVVTNSAFTAAEFNETFQPQRPAVRIGAPVEPRPTRPVGASSTTLLLPTSGWPHKISRQAIAWLLRWVGETGFSGAVHGYGPLPKDQVWPARLGWTHHGRIGDSALDTLLTPDATLIYFSDYEGYGLPPVEAAATGVRAIASDLPALRETLSADALFDNGDYSSFHRTLSRAISHPPLPPQQLDTPRQVAQRWLDQLRQAGPGVPKQSRSNRPTADRRAPFHAA